MWTVSVVIYGSIVIPGATLRFRSTIVKVMFVYTVLYSTGTINVSGLEIVVNDYVVNEPL